MRLHDYFRSTAAYRVRIVLNLKGLDYEQVSVNLREGAQQAADYLAVNAQGLVPALEVEGGLLTQSLAICEYLEETHPEPALLPREPLARARVRALAEAVACDIHPLNNLRLLKYLTGELGVSEDQKLAWYHHWIREGFNAIEQMLRASPDTGEFCHGDAPTLADACLVPQVYNARRFELDIDPYPGIRRIEENCLALAAFDRARPEKQPDAPVTD
ncbi:MAG: maleylacetoacetate isomerase [Ectothiorhodospiraceae bacterium]|jgi:maleylacetoacetate isomerase